jgi:hypothetical protein
MAVFPMTFPHCRALAVRFTSVLLALGLLLSPSLTQVSAAERCRTRCDAAGVQTTPPHCCKSHAAKANVAGQSGDDHGERGSSDGQTKYCPGCNGRPLLVEPASMQLTLDPALICVLPDAPAAPGSADVCFAIFHPPRA